MRDWITNVKNEFVKNIKTRYIYIVLIFAIIFFFGIICKESYVIKIDSNNKEKLFLNNKTIVENIGYRNSNFKQITIPIEKSNNESDDKYIFQIEEDGQVLTSRTVSAKNLNTEDNVVLTLPNRKTSKDLKLVIIPHSSNLNNLFIYTTYQDSSILSVDYEEMNSTSLCYSERYERAYTIGYIAVCIILFIIVSLLIVLFDTKKIHNFSFCAALSIGLIVIFINPILDTPDEPAHICRAELTSRGYLFINGNSDNYNISNSVAKIIDNQFRTLSESNIVNDRMDYTYDGSYYNYANMNLFIGYIPQAIGVGIAKILGYIFGASNVWILIFGRLSNLIFYCCMLRYAIKKAPIFKIPLAIIGIAPMSIFIAASFNPDTTTYALIMVCLSYILYLYKKQNITQRDMAVFSILAIIIGLVKLPYLLFGAVLLFFDKSKFIDKKTYNYRWLFVMIIFAICGGWAMISMINSTDSPHNAYYIQNNINPKEQVNYIKNNMFLFIRTFLYDIIDRLGNYANQLNTFGWLTYMPNKGLMTIYTIFIGSMLFMFPNEEIINRKLKIGIILISIGIYILTCLILFLTWNPVASSTVVGVQGRYFVPLLAIVSLLSSGSAANVNNRETLAKKTFGIGLIFMIVFVITILVQYY